MQKLAAALRLIWLDELFVGHGIVTIGLVLFCRTFTKPSEFAIVMGLSLTSSQVCLITVWSTWSHDRIEVRLGHLLWRMGWLYLVLLLLGTMNEDRHLAALWSLTLSMGCFALTAWLPAEVLRWFGWRRVQLGVLPVPPPRFQFRLADVLRWTTLACMLLAVMSRYREEVTGWGGIVYAVLVAFSMMTSAPTGLVISILLWLALGERWSTARTIVAYLLPVAALCLFALAANFSPIAGWVHDGKTWVAIWGLAVIGSLVTLATAFILRAQGWKVARNSRQEKLAASPLASRQSSG